MNGTYGLNDSEAYDEAFDEADEAFDEADEAYDEAKRGRKPLRPISVPRAGSSYQPRPNPAAAAQVVTQPQLRAALQRVSQQINTNAKAIKVVDGRIRNVASEQGRLHTAVRKEIADRKLSMTAVRKDLQATREAAVFIPVLQQLSGNSAIGAVAPLLLLGNDVTQEPTAAGASSSSGGFLGLGGGGGSSLTGLIALVALTGGFGKK